MRRALSPSLNPTGLGSAVAAVYAGIAMAWNATHHHAVIDPQVEISAAGAALFLYSRFKVTPVADPRDGNGAPLAPALAAAAPRQAGKPTGNVMITGEAAGTSHVYGPVVGEPRGGYRGGARAQDVGPPPDVPSGSVTPPEKTLRPPGKGT